MLLFTTAIELATAAHASGGPDGYTDKCTKIPWFQHVKGALYDIAHMDDEINFELEASLYDALNHMYYLPSTIKVGQYYSAPQFKEGLIKWPRFKESREAPKLAPPPVDVNAPIVNTRATIDHAAGMYHYLKDKHPHVAILFEDIVKTRSDWKMDDLLASLGCIKKAAQSNPEGIVGKVYPISEMEYNIWSMAADKSTYQVGPYLAMKIAQQARALIKVEGDVVTLTRASETITCLSAYTFKGDGTKFVKGLTYKNRELQYVDVPAKAYLLAQIFHRFKKIEGNKNGVLFASSYPSKEAQKAKIGTPPTLVADQYVKGVDSYGAEVITQQPGVIRTVCDLIANEFNNSKVESADIDIVIDRLARICAKYVDQAKMSEYEPSAHTLALSKLNMYNAIFEESAKILDPNEAMKAIRSVVPSPNLSSASALLAKEREHRNHTNYLQYNYKSLASYQGNNTIPAVDTILKGERIKAFLDMYKIKADSTIMYGVAFGHMVDTFKRDDGYLKLYDKDPKAAAKDSVQQGNVLGIEKDYVGSAGSLLIIDDTMTEGPIGEKEALELKMKYGNDKIVVGDAGDWAKIQAFSRIKGDVTIVSKISAKSIVKYNTAIKNLFLVKNARPWRHIGFYKFGKLHNNEVFLVLSNAKTLSETTERGLLGHEMNIVATISLANTFVSHLSNAAVHNGVVPRAEMNAVWKKLIDGLPVKMPWYGRVFKKEVTYGSAVLLANDVQDIMSLLDSGDSGWANEIAVVEEEKPLFSNKE